MVDAAELHTETFTNSQGWTVVRVTHRPSGISAQRERTKQLRSSVQAECFADLRELLADAPPELHHTVEDELVSRDDFEALVARVTALEARVDDTS